MNRSPAVGETVIRTACDADAAVISDLAFRSKAYWGYPGEFMEACREELTYTPSRLNDARFAIKVLERDGRLLGFYALERLTAIQWEMEGLFVEPDFIGQGLGRRLMAHAKQYAAAQGAETLIVQSDPHAQRFYEAAGGVLVGKRQSDSIPGRYLPLFQFSL